MWLNKLFKKGVKPNLEALKNEAENEKGLNEEMVSSTVDLEPKENNGLAKIFENTEKEEKEEASENATEEEDEENKQE